MGRRGGCCGGRPARRRRGGAASRARPRGIMVKRRTAWIIGGATLTVVLAAGVAWLLIPRGGSAEDQALAYLRALEVGDLTAVNAAGLDASADAAAAFNGAAEYISEVNVTPS